MQFNLIFHGNIANIQVRHNLWNFFFFSLLRKREKGFKGFRCWEHTLESCEKIYYLFDFGMIQILFCLSYLLIRFFLYNICLAYSLMFTDYMNVFIINDININLLVEYGYFDSTHL